MNRFLNGVARAFAETFDLPGPILEIGSYQVPGQEEIADLRTLFPGKEFVGVDVRAGPGPATGHLIDRGHYETPSRSPGRERWVLLRWFVEVKANQRVEVPRLTPRLGPKACPC